MHRRIFTILMLLAVGSVSPAQNTYLGFDRNSYPGDDLLPMLSKTFAYTGYWLNNPPQATSNSWQGKRSKVLSSSLGFLILFNGRLDADLKKQTAATLGRVDAAAAISAAQREGFPLRAVIFLDVEEGGRLLPEQLGYVLAWADAVEHSGYRAGVYCSGMIVPDGPGHTITTAQDIYVHDPSIALFVYNDACPPSPGCVLPSRPLSPPASGTPTALVWQYAQSPRRGQFTGRCAKTYSADNNCYAPETSQTPRTFIDLNVSSSPDPSSSR